MNYITIGIIIASVLLLIWIVKTYNELVNLRMNAERQTSHVDVHLKKKFDLIPALIEIVKGYAKHEKGTLEEITRLRSQWTMTKNIDEKMKTANKLETMLSRLLIIQERYPNLKANRNFMNLQKQLSWVERELVHERKVYNKRVSWYNVKLQTFPSVLIAKLFMFEAKQFFSLEKENQMEI